MAEKLINVKLYDNNYSYLGTAKIDLSDYVCPEERPIVLSTTSPDRKLLRHFVRRGETDCYDEVDPTPVTIVPPKV